MNLSEYLLSKVDGKGFTIKELHVLAFGYMEADSGNSSVGLTNITKNNFYG